MPETLSPSKKFRLPISWKSLTNNPILLTIILLLLTSSIVVCNLLTLGGGKYPLAAVTAILANPTANLAELKLLAQKLSTVTVDDLELIANGLWAALATIIAGAGLAVSGLVVQSITRNPLADASTLGFMQAGIFALLVALAFGITAFYLKFLFVVLGALVGAALLSLIIFFNRGVASSAKVILFGLAIGVIFKTVAFLVRSGDKFLTNVSYNYTLGGAESIGPVIGNDAWKTLYISAGLTGGGLIIFGLLTKPLSLLELGDETSARLGLRTTLIRSFSAITLVLLIPAAVIIIGNLAFIGLFSAHITRYLLQTRSYTKLMLPSIMVGVTLVMTGLLFSNFLPSINSGLWMTFLGGAYMVYWGIKGLR